jgi:hypothetical protein
MHFHTQHHYDADTNRVYGMLTDPAFLDSLFAAADGLPHQVSVDGGHTVLRAQAPAPQQITRFTGPTLSVTLDIAWGAADASGRRSGPVSVSVAKVPASLIGTATIAADTSGSTVTYDGEFTVRIPLVGAKLERTAAPYLTQGLDAQQDLGRAWLASH